MAAEQCGEAVVWDELADHAAFLRERARSVRAIVTASTIPLPCELTNFPALELIAYFGAGYANVDLAECRARGIAVSNVPATNNQDVADVAIGLMIGLVRRLTEGDRVVRAGGWDRMLPVPMAPSLGDLRYGIVGLGDIGMEIAARLEPFGGTIRWHGPRPKPDSRWPYCVTLLELARESDVLLVAVRGDDTTRHLIDAGVIAALGPAGYLINVSRGFVVDEAALVAALREGRLAGAGLDVFDPEPTDPAKWHGLNAILTPHIAGWARAGIVGGQNIVAENLRRQFAGEPLLTPVSG